MKNALIVSAIPFGASCFNQCFTYSGWDKDNHCQPGNSTAQRCDRYQDLTAGYETDGHVHHDVRNYEPKYNDTNGKKGVTRGALQLDDLQENCAAMHYQHLACIESMLGSQVCYSFLAKGTEVRHQDFLSCLLRRGEVWGFWLRL